MFGFSSSNAGAQHLQLLRFSKSFFEPINHQSSVERQRVHLVSKPQGSAAWTVGCVQCLTGELLEEQLFTHSSHSLNKCYYLQILIYLLWCSETLSSSCPSSSSQLRCERLCNISPCERGNLIKQGRVSSLVSTGGASVDLYSPSSTGLVTHNC